MLNKHNIFSGQLQATGTNLQNPAGISLPVSVLSIPGRHAADILRHIHVGFQELFCHLVTLEPAAGELAVQVIVALGHQKGEIQISQVMENSTAAGEAACPMTTVF
jgi:hypothetical protein